MKVIFQCPVPFSFTHGGQQIQIEQTQEALQAIGLTVEPLRWWDEGQTGDILHHFGRLPMDVLQAARQKGMKIVIADLLTAQGSRPEWRHAVQKWICRAMDALPAHWTRGRFGWRCYKQADACVALTSWEAHLLNHIYGVPNKRIHVVPNGVEDLFLKSKPSLRGKWLICTATITARKRVLELAQAAVRGCTPLWVIGKPYTETDPYAQAFTRFAAAQSEWIRYEGPMEDRRKLAAIYRSGRGFVLLSEMESLSLSALEAAASECPLLLSDLPWARTVFGSGASYCPLTASPERAARLLRDFYDQAPQLALPNKPLSWIEVAQQLRQVYEALCLTGSNGFSR